MRELVVAPAAASDIETILLWSQERFGREARLRYEQLLIKALQDVAKDPRRAGSHAVPKVSGDARTYHLAHSRDRKARSSERVKNPRHFLLYRVSDDGRVEVGRVLHDSMDLRRHLPDEYRV